jgi:type IV secretory pathway VirJ component
MCEWRRKEEQLQTEQTLLMPVTKWPDLEAEVNNWLTHHKNNRISVVTKMIIFKVRKCVVGGTTLETVRTAKQEASVLTFCVDRRK